MTENGCLLPTSDEKMWSFSVPILILLANSIYVGTGRKAAKRETLVCARF
jgi:hypothetical protein